MNATKKSARNWVALMLMLLAILATACSSSSAEVHPASSTTPTRGLTTPNTSQGSAHMATIIIKDFAYHPDRLTVSPGELIKVENHDSVTHTLTSDSGDAAYFNTGYIHPGQTAYIHAPQKPGTYPYLCLIHQFMTGVIIVR
jgi:plastocyanin